LKSLKRSLKAEGEAVKAEALLALNDVEGVGKTLDEAPRARLCNTLKVHAVDKHLHRPQQSSSQVDGLGHIYVRAVFYNAVDYIQYLEGRLRLDDVRMAEVEALIDTGATFPALPEDVVAKLALPTLGEHPRRLAEAGRMPRGLAEDLERLAGLRNILVHRYLEVRIDLLYKTAEETVERIAGEFIEWVKAINY